MLEGREVLQKNDFLVGLESLLKKYGYTELYCLNSFDGTKSTGTVYIIVAPHRMDAADEISLYVDPTYKCTHSWDENDPSICYIDTCSIPSEDKLIYKDGVFYGR